MNIYTSVEHYNLKFGLKRDKVRDILGEPSSIEVYELSEHDNSEQWTYDSLNLELSFDSDYHYRLSTVSDASEFVKIDGVSVIGMKENILLEYFPNLQRDEEDDLDDELGYYYHNKDEKLMLFVDFNIVARIVVYE